MRLQSILKKVLDTFTILGHEVVCASPEIGPSQDTGKMAWVVNWVSTAQNASAPFLPLRPCCMTKPHQSIENTLEKHFQRSNLVGGQMCPCALDLQSGGANLLFQICLQNESPRLTCACASDGGIGAGRSK